MTLTVKAEKIEGVSVYGLPQYEYALEGTKDRLQFCSVTMEASFQQTAAVEAQIMSIASAVKARRRKLEDYGKALSAIAWFIPNIAQKKSQKSDDLLQVGWGSGGKDYYAFFAKINAIYGLGIEVGVSPPLKEGEPPPKNPNFFTMTRGAIQKGQAKLEDAVDRENSNMQQEMTTLDGFVSKRDKSFAVAAKVVKKYDNAAESTIKAMV